MITNPHNHAPKSRDNPFPKSNLEKDFLKAHKDKMVRCPQTFSFVMNQIRQCDVKQNTVC